MQTMTEKNEQSRENRVRRLAREQGLALKKSRCRVQEAPEYGTYMLVSAEDGTRAVWTLADGFGLTLAEAEAALKDDEAA